MAHHRPTGQQERSHAPARGLAIAVALLAALPGSRAGAQVVEVAPFTVSQFTSSFYVPRSRSVDVAVGVDGSVVFFWDAVSAAVPSYTSTRYVRRFTPAGNPLGPEPVGDAIGGGELWPRIAAPLFLDDTVNYALGFPYAIAYEGIASDRGEVLHGDEALFYPTGHALTSRGTADHVPAAVAVRADVRAVYVSWRFDDVIRVRDTGAPTANAQFAVDRDPAVRALAVVPLPDRGYVIGWGSDGDPAAPSAQTAHYTYEAEGPFAPTVLSSTTVLAALAVSHDGTALAAVGTRPRGTATPNEIWLQRLDPYGAPIGDEILVHAAPPGVRVSPDVEFDALGNVHVAWTEGETALRARGFDAAGSPQDAAVTLVDGAVGRDVRLARLPSGSVVNAWTPYDGTSVHALISSLCRPTIVCGDGALDPYCEVCDDPAGNSDTIPDRCRTDCRPPRCNDGVTDAGEECDDGNATDCDGCSAACTLEVGLGCGDGIPYPTCGETCDDQNAVAGDGCTTDCTLERVRGGGAGRTDCVTEWAVNNPKNVPLTDPRGGFSARQTCRDGDPLCDFDGAADGRCTFRLRTCANNTDITACASPRLASWQLIVPSAAKAARDPVAAAVRNAMVDTVPSAIVGPTDRDVCSADTELVVPLRSTGLGKLTIKTRATLYDGTKDTDKMTFVCVQ